jgi:hypothetical protein
MDDDLYSLANGRQPHYWKTTSIFRQMEDDLKSLANGRQPHYCEKWKMV